MKKYFVLWLALAILLTAMPAMAESEKSDDIVILHTNDVHTHVDGPLSYSVLAAVKADLEREYNYVLLVDAGDHVQGTAYGSLDRGESVIRLMNGAGYDLAVPGNHEFDYGMDGFENIRKWAEYPYISCNFYHADDHVRNENVLDSYVTFLCGDVSVAFVGICAPETITSSTPVFFQDGSGEYIYGFGGGADGKALYDDVQEAVDEARSFGADYVIAVGHLGIESAAGPWSSRDVIANVSGLDGFIDGHSHHFIEGESVTDRDGEEVILNQTGEHFARIGMMVIDGETGEIETGFISVEELTQDGAEGEETESLTGYRLESQLYGNEEYVRDEDIVQMELVLMQQVEEQLGTVAGRAEAVLDNYTPEGSRLVRRQETNSGDFAADALYWLFDSMGAEVDGAIVNGGGIRNEAIVGVITYETCMDMHAYGNSACLMEMSGQQLLDALEYGARYVGENQEEGGFVQVSGIRYEIHAYWPASVVTDELDVWVSGPTGGYRVRNVQIYDRETGTWEALDPEAKYNIAGYDYMLLEEGDGMTMFEGAGILMGYVMQDYMALAEYVQDFEEGVVRSDNSPLLEKYPGMLLDYGSVDGSGRIVIVTEE